jgi:hypothetical protein
MKSGQGSDLPYPLSYFFNRSLQIGFLVAKIGA